MPTTDSLDGRSAHGGSGGRRGDLADLLTAEFAVAEKLEAGIEDLIEVEVEAPPRPVARKLPPLEGRRP